MRLLDNVYLSFVLAGKTTNEVFEQWELDAPTRPRFGRNWWYWLPSLTSNGGRFRSYENTDINFHWLCLSISLTVYSWKEFEDKGKTARKALANQPTESGKNSLLLKASIALAKQAQKEALAEQPTQEPVAWQALCGGNHYAYGTAEIDLKGYHSDFWQRPLYTHPKEALEQPTQEPVGWLDANEMLAEFMHKDLKAEHEKRGSFTPRDFPIPVYLHPHQWQGLSDDEIWDIANFLGKNKEWDYPVMFAKTIEKVLREKNT